MKNLFNIELTDEEFDNLMCQQNQGKELKVIDGKVVAVEKELTDLEKISTQYSMLKNWFDTYYTQHEQKYRRLHLLKAKCDDNSDPYDKLLELYAEAENKRRQLQELEGKLNNDAITI